MRGAMGNWIKPTADKMQSASGQYLDRVIHQMPQIGPEEVEENEWP